jgi:hypothetical protein
MNECLVAVVSKDGAWCKTFLDFVPQARSATGVPGVDDVNLECQKSVR